jgi:hypothetical protein
MKAKFYATLIAAGIAFLWMAYSEFVWVGAGHISPYATVPIGIGAFLVSLGFLRLVLKVRHG